MSAMPTRRKRRSEETALSASIRASLIAKGCHVIRINSGVVEAKNGGWVHGAQSGTPDLLVIRPRQLGRLNLPEFTFLEVKTKTGARSDAQIKWGAWATLEGVRLFVVRGISEAVDAVFKSEVRS